MNSALATQSEVLLQEKMVLRGWYYLFRFRACLTQEKQELDMFLGQYYVQLGGWLQHAATLQCAADTSDGGETLTVSGHLHFLQKSIYRDVLKLCHPDLASDVVRPYARQWMEAAQHAYAKGDGLQLAELRLELQRKHYCEIEYKNALEVQYCMLQREVAVLREAVKKLRGSPAYHLQQRIIQARNKGFDLLDYIVRQLRASDISILSA